MGMAASQARFLSLTARKSNIEYEGQQINQQRTTLANQSANLYNQMLTLNVPTPPNVQDYTRLVYTFKVPGVNSVATVSQFTKNPDTGKYTVSFTYSTEEIGCLACTNEQRSSINDKTDLGKVPNIDEDGYLQSKNTIKVGSNDYNAKRVYVDSDGHLRASKVPYLATDPFVRNESTDEYISFEEDPTSHEVTYSVGSKETAGSYSSLPGNDYGMNHFLKDQNDSKWVITTSRGKQLTLTPYSGKGIDNAHADVYKELLKKYNNDANFEMYYANIGTEESPVYTYYVASDLNTGYAEPEEINKKSIYYTVGEYDEFHQATYENCTLTRDANNRVLSIGYDGEDITVSSITETDKASYDDAMNEYTYKSYLYEQEMNNINAKTSVIQQQDKTLELRLKQLDTEESAIKAEMEAVKGVVKDNIDRSFKSFA